MWLFIMAVIGSCIGSFLHLLQSRIAPYPPHTIPYHALCRKRSYCQRCQHTLSIWQLIPLFSWLLLKGTCYYCRCRIHPSHFIYEALFALLFVISRFYFSQVTELLIFILLSCWFFLLAIYDSKYYLLPDILTLPLLCFGLLLSYLDLSIISFKMAIIGSILSGGILWLIASLFYAIKKYPGLGLGDIKLTFALGTLFPLTKIPTIFTIACLTALLWIIIIWSVKRKTLIKIPFGPFILFGAWTVLLYN